MATSSLVLFLIFAISLFCLVISERDTLDYVSNLGTAYLKQHVGLNNAKHYAVKRSVDRNLVKRDVASDKICDTQKQRYLSDLQNTVGFHSSYTFVNDSSKFLSLGWGLKDNVMAVTTEEHFLYKKKSTVYVSTDSGKSFVNINTKIDNSQIKSDYGLQKHPLNASRIYLVTDGKTYSTSVLYITENEGSTFEKAELNFELDVPIMFHPDGKYIDYMMVLSKRNLYISKNNGKTWKKIKDKAVNAKWGSVDEDTPSTIYCTVQVKEDEFSWAKLFGLTTESRDNDLETTLNWGETWTNLHSHVYGFGVKGKFIYVSVFLNEQSEENDKRLLEVSRDKGKTWNEVQLPSIEPERFYSIVDMSDDMVIIHVDDIGNEGYGTLYTSDSTGIIFTESLRRHMITNGAGISDFYMVRSMRGVYITSQMEVDGSIHTMISYDRGGEWNSIPQPAGSSCADPTKACTLQIHGIYSLSTGHDVNPPFSVESAKGLIIVHAHVGSSVDATIPDIYISTDGGYTWRKALDGAHHYQIADQGGLIVAVPYITYPKVVKFSFDEGNCWHEYVFTSDDITFAGLLTAPLNKEMILALWGYGRHDSVWKVNVIDFAKLKLKTCTNADYTTWTPHIANEKVGCFLGVKETFTKIKKDSWCHNMNGLDLASKGKQETCQCDKADYECDYGYYRSVGSYKCQLDPEFKGPPVDICERGHVEKIVAIGYHKIPGDKCTQALMTNEYVLVDLKKVCEEGDRSLLEKAMNSSYLSKCKGANCPMQQTDSKICTSTTTLAALLVITIIVLVVVVSILMYRSLMKKGNRPYRYSRMSRNGNDPNLDNCRLVIGDDDPDDGVDFQPMTNGNTTHRQSSATTRQPNQSQAAGEQMSKEATSGDPHDDKPLPLTDNNLRSYHDGSDDDMIE